MSLRSTRIFALDSICSVCFAYKAYDSRPERTANTDHYARENSTSRCMHICASANENKIKINFRRPSENASTNNNRQQFDLNRTHTLHTSPTCTTKSKRILPYVLHDMYSFSMSANIVFDRSLSLSYSHALSFSLESDDKMHWTRANGTKLQWQHFLARSLPFLVATTIRIFQPWIDGWSLKLKRQKGQQKHSYKPFPITSSLRARVFRVLLHFHVRLDCISRVFLFVPNWSRSKKQTEPKETSSFFVAFPYFEGKLHLGAFVLAVFAFV